MSAVKAQFKAALGQQSDWHGPDERRAVYVLKTIPTEARHQMSNETKTAVSNIRARHKSSGRPVKVLCTQMKDLRILVLLTISVCLGGPRRKKRSQYGRTGCA